MNRLKTVTLFFVGVLFSLASFAQDINQGKDLLYRERFQSAKDVFQKLSAANPSDEVAAYYLGQAMIGLEDVAGAKALYQQKLSAIPNSPLLLAGMGHVELLEGKTADARSRFETAVSLSGGKRIDVLNAVGAPNSDPDVKNGDANYAIEKLTQARNIKGFKDPEVLANLGDAYRKIGDGGNAILSYDAALAINPKYARAIYRKGRLYQSQGIIQEQLYMKYYNDAIAADASYAPVYNTLFNYYYQTDVPKSAQYLEKWLQNSDADPKACYYRASIKFAQGLFQDAITQADQCIASQGTNVYPNVYGVKAISYNRLGDSVNAKAAYDQYFKVQSPDKIGAGDYSSYGLLLLKFPGNEAQAAQYITKAVAMDSLEANKITYLKALANAFRDRKDYVSSADWFDKVLYIKRNPTNLDLYNAGYDYFRSGKFDSAMAIFNKYADKYPDDIFGYYMAAKAASGIDTLRQGLSVQAYERAIAVGEKAADKAKVKDQLAGSYTFMSQYYLEIKKDNTKAMEYADKALAVDPANATAIALKDFISKGGKATPKPPTPPAPPAKPKTPAKKK